LENRS